MYLIFDTETTGKAKNWNLPYTEIDNWPRMVQISWQLHDKTGKLIEVKNYIIKPDGFEIPYEATQIHGITTQRAIKQGVDINFVLGEFNNILSKTNFIIGQNLQFDINVLGAEYIRAQKETIMFDKTVIDTMHEGTEFCQIPGRGKGFKWPTLAELHQKLFNEDFDAAHNSAADVEATARCFFEMIRIGVISAQKAGLNQDEYNEFLQKNPKTIQAIGLNIKPYEPEGFEEITDENTGDETGYNQEISSEELNKIQFTHLHLHTQFSILDGATEITSLVQKAKEDEVQAIAITDHGNMYGAKTFYNELRKENIKPILGCEVYVAYSEMEKKDKTRYHLILLAKNLTGYKNLIKLVSLGFTKGYYYKPRIDKKVLAEYKEGIIVLSACLGGEIPQKLMKETFAEAEKTALWFKENFGDDFYLELQRHKSETATNNTYQNQVFVNSKLLELSKKHNIKVVATNDVHYLNKEDFEVQQRLIAIGQAKYLSELKNTVYTGEEYFKTQAEMRELFKDLPQALYSTQEIVDKIEEFELDREPVMPDFKLPENFDSENEYLKYLTYEGAKKRWGENLSDEIINRLELELKTIEKMGFPGYFLIVWDFLKAAREMGVIVGPGRGSAAGSAVAYCLRITEIDPIKYSLLFERFLNPDRISMPDIDIDFDDDGREKILEWVVNKYGEKRVAHIITFGSMAAKSSIRDVARVQEYPLSEADKMAKLVPEKPGTKLKDAIKEIPELQEINKKTDESGQVLKYAQALEGSVRNTGTHACGIIIGKEDLDNFIPITKVDGASLKIATQYDGAHVENIGLLKMDFLGLKTLSIIKDTLDNIKLSKGIDVDIDNVDLTDEKTFELYSRGETIGLFQFESPGMQKHLKNLKPSKFEDLIAMNALYRPGPMEYIPDFIDRKHGRKKIKYDLPMMKKYLEETYGITVYQEQVMLLSRLLAGFTRGESDSLRKAMGKKKKAEMDKLKIKFIDGCKANTQFVEECNAAKKNIDDTIEKIWKDWEAFAKYAFNKSHATCYSYVSFQTAFLKAHYPAEFMAAVLSRNRKDIKKITFFMNECRNMGIKVLGPDINESYKDFTVNKDGNIRFGLAAIKDVGENAVENIIEERKKQVFTDVYNFIERVQLTAVNKKTIESLAYAGAFDEMNIERNQFFDDNGEASDDSFVIRLINYGNKYQSDKSSGPNLFGEIYNTHIEKPELPSPREWNIIDKLKHEKEKIGMYLSSHPLSSFKYIIDKIKPISVSYLNDLDKLKNKEFTIVGYITEVKELMTKKGVPYARVTIEDFSGSHTLTIFSKQWAKWKNILVESYSIAVNAKVEIPSWKKDSKEYQLTINSIDLLYNLKSKYIKALNITIPSKNVNNKIIDEIFNIIQSANSGETPVKFTIINTEEKIEVLLTSKSIKIDATEEIVNNLSKSDIYKAEMR